jgi:hypothetical protein
MIAFQLREAINMNGMDFKMYLTAAIIGGFFLEMALVACGVK